LAFTVSAAAVVLAVPAVFVKTARYRLPFCMTRALNVMVLDVAPTRFVKDTPLLELSCHCTVGVGDPIAAATNVTVAPSVTVSFAGF
jgi:hypothetical protein